MVTFVGMAARFVTNDIPIDTIASIKSGKLKPTRKTTITVMGVSMQP